MPHLYHPILDKIPPCTRQINRANKRPTMSPIERIESSRIDGCVTHIEISIINATCGYKPTGAHCLILGERKIPLDALLVWIGDNPSYAHYLVLSLACLEALVGIGLFISGALLLSIAIFLYAQQLISIEAILFLAFTGAAIGDQCGYWLGRWIGPTFHTTKFAARYRRHIDRAEALIRRYGWGAILIGRIIPAIRSIVPLITGISGYSALKYILFDLLAVGIWTLLLGLAVVGTSGLFAS